MNGSDVPATVAGVPIYQICFAAFLFGFGLHLISFPLTAALLATDRLRPGVELLRDIAYVLMSWGAFGGIIFLGAPAMPPEFRIALSVALFYFCVKSANALRKRLAIRATIPRP